VTPLPTREELRTLQNRAARLMRKALAEGTLVKPDVCEDCEERPESSQLHGHHHNGYGLGHETDVQWLCAPCHRRAHPKEPTAPEISLRSLAKFLAVSPKTIRRYIHKGLIPEDAIKRLPGGDLRFDRNRVKEILAPHDPNRSPR
jgi:hypothetical protein